MIGQTTILPNYFHFVSLFPFFHLIKPNESEFCVKILLCLVNWTSCLMSRGEKLIVTKKSETSRSFKCVGWLFTVTLLGGAIAVAVLIGGENENGQNISAGFDISYSQLVSSIQIRASTKKAGLSVQTQTRTGSVPPPNSWRLRIPMLQTFWPTTRIFSMMTSHQRMQV